MISSSLLHVDREGAVAVLTMSDAGKRNALSSEMMRALIAALDEVGAQRSIRAVVLRGEGPAFSAGHDLRELGAASRDETQGVFDLCVTLMERLQSIEQPTIAEVDGVATAAGCQLVASCDLAVASTRSTFATPGVKIGLFCSTPMVALTRAVGRKRAMEMLLLGEPIDAATALAWGLLNRVVEPERVHDEALAFAARIAVSARATVALGKAAFYEQIERPQREAYAFTKGVMVENARAADAVEGIGAFLEKRKARWES
ncbi:MAG TPA: enoyl-CoA hydratase [Candidatus Dormibacteraeota bacterium]|nr:enoyl-CoA hydratase [Candidatus Dormibacteraeota bacterium]